MDRESDREIDDQLDRDHEREGGYGTYRPLRRRQAIPIVRDAGELNPPVKAASEPCPNDHEQLKADPTLFAELAQIGTKAVRGGTLHFANCNLCHTTLSRKVAS